MASSASRRRRRHRDHGKRTRRGGCRSSSSSADLSLPRAPPLSGNPNPSPSSTTSTTSGRRVGGLGRKEAEARDWAELPMDAILAVFHKHDHIGILMGAGAAPRRVEPELWRRI
uniref:F-box domain-containing protein n=1 Tax=Oryza glumipatula TaxID=40148 RepID=A0A0E0ARU7_9ORYZ